MKTHIGLFSGIGGFELAARWAEFNTIAMCEIDEFCQSVLKYHFPNVELYGDIRATDFTVYRGQCDVITGGFPCQPFSIAGKRKGTADNRFLWPEMLRAISEIKPSWVIAENVYGLVTQQKGLVFERVLTDLEALGYEAQTFIVPACAKGAPHRRDRVWVIGHAQHNGLNAAKDTGSGNKRGNHNKAGTKEIFKFEGPGSLRGIIANTNGKRHEKFDIATLRNKPGFVAGISSDHWENWPTQPPVCNRDDGLSNRLVNIAFSKWRNQSIKAMGNAIVPQVAYDFFSIINMVDC